MSLAFRCGVCSRQPSWRLDRRGDAVVDWACDDHMVRVLWELQRTWETELVVRVVREADRRD